MEKLVHTLIRLSYEGYRVYFGMFKLGKTTIKRNFDYELIKKKLDIEIALIEKKDTKHREYFEKFPNPKQIDFLEKK